MPTAASNVTGSGMLPNGVTISKETTSPDVVGIAE